MAGIKAPPLPADFKVICSACGDTLDAATQFSKGQLKKKHPRCRACAPNKFSNQATNGHQSKKESKKAQHYRMLERVGVIHRLEEQVAFELIPRQLDPLTGKVLELACSYVADFVYYDNEGWRHVIDAKGMRTDVYRIKRKLMLHVHKIRIEEV